MRRFLCRPFRLALINPHLPRHANGNNNLHISFLNLRQAMEKSAHKLPKNTETVVVEGGNHRGFAHYTRQPLDWEVRR